MILFFCFKQKTAYEMRISDWSSDVCSSDLMLIENIRAQRADIERLTEASHQAGDQTIAERLAEQIVDIDEVLPRLINLIAIPGTTDQIGRASCRERVCQDVSISVVAGSLKKQKR